MFGMGIGNGRVGVAAPDNLAVVAGTADTPVEVGVLGTATDERGGGVDGGMHAVFFFRQVERRGSVRLLIEIC